MIRKLFFLTLPLSLLLGSCRNKANQETVDKMADEMCSAMSLVNKEDPMSYLETQSALAKIWDKQKEDGEYVYVTDEQLQESMGNKCPEGLKIYLKMVADEEEGE